VNYAREGSISSVYVTGFQKGVKLNQSWSNGISDSKIVGNTDKNLELGDQSNDFVASDCQIDNAGNYGIHINGDSQMVSFIGCVIQNCGKDALLLDAGRSINITGCYFEKNNTSGTSNLASIRATGSVLTVLGLNITGCQFWDSKTESSISLDKAQGVSITGSSFNPIGEGTTAYTIKTTTNTYNVSIIGSYKEKPFNDLGNCITSIASGDTSTFRYNLHLRRSSPIMSINSTGGTESMLRMLVSDVAQSELRQEANGDLKLRHLNSGNSTMEDIFRMPTSNAWLQMYKPLNMNGYRVQNITSLLMQNSVATDVLNNSIFVDSADSKLKFKDSTGVVKLVNLT
jgi:Right handed beta helix region